MEHYNYIEFQHTDLRNNLIEGMEVQALISVYGSDETIKAMSDIWRASIAFTQQHSTERPSLALMILQLGKSLFVDTAVSEGDIQFMLMR